MISNKTLLLLFLLLLNKVLSVVKLIDRFQELHTNSEQTVPLKVSCIIFHCACCVTLKSLALLGDRGAIIQLEPLDWATTTAGLFFAFAW